MSVYRAHDPRIHAHTAGPQWLHAVYPRELTCKYIYIYVYTPAPAIPYRCHAKMHAR